MQTKAVFFDRDGVINNEENNYYIFRPGDFFLNEGIGEAMQELKSKGFIFIIISNQGGISKSYYTHEDVNLVHEKLHALLKKFDIEITEIYYCPHHSDNENCLCRKPKIISFEKAIARFNIDRGKSYFVGDRETDMEAGRKARLSCILVEPNQNMRFLGKVIN